MYKKIIFACLIISTITLQNCKPEAEPEPTAVVAPELSLPLALPAVDGVLAASVTITKEAGTDIIVGTAHAMFYKNKNSTLKLEAGTGKLNSKDLIKSDDNIYFYAPTTAEPKGIVYQTQVYWKFTGNVTNDVPVIDDNDGAGFPSSPTINEYILMNTYQDKLITWVNSNNADSVILIIKGPSATYRRVFNNLITSHTITKEEITKLGLTTSGNLKVINYTMKLKTVGTKSFALIKQKVAICTKVSITN